MKRLPLAIGASFVAGHTSINATSYQISGLLPGTTYNVAFVQELGHFDWCSHIDANSPQGGCNGLEGPPGDQEPADADDTGCFSPKADLMRAKSCVVHELTTSPKVEPVEIIVR